VFIQHGSKRAMKMVLRKRSSIMPA
jgi:hypothetical protein